MTQIVRKVTVPGVPEKVIIRSIEMISEALVRDAEEQFKAITDTRVSEDTGYVEAYVAFFPYQYDFIWKVAKGTKGYDVTLDARTAGRWYEFVFDMDTKLQNLVMTQWSALLNFCMGYVTAATYSTRHKVSPQEHIRRARAGLSEKTAVVRKKHKRHTRKKARRK
jgi:hypothetical protein